MRVLGLVPARAGSKGIPGKNLRPLAGRPLLEYTAAAALDAARLDRIVLSTDSEKIAALGRQCGLDVPFLRPLELARDETPMLPVAQHALSTLEEAGERYDALCLLQPTSPLREPGEIDRCVELLESSGADAVVTILAVPSEYNPHWVYLRRPDGGLTLAAGGGLEPIPRRQDLPPAFHRDGSVYVATRRAVIELDSLYGKRLLGLEMSPERRVNLDTLEDWRRAERLLEAEAH